MDQSITFLIIMFAALPALAFAESAPLHSPRPDSTVQPTQATTVASLQDSKQTVASDPPAEKPWSVTVGLGVIHGSLYQGSAQRELIPLPIIEATYHDWSLELFNDLRNRFINTEEFVMGAGLNYDFVQKDDALPKNRRGLGDVKGGATRSYVDSDSLLITAGAASEFPLNSESLIGDIGIGATWANDDHMRSYYGVNAQQSAHSSLCCFNAAAGIMSENLSAGVTYLISERWLWNLSGGVDILQGDAADSPVVAGDTQPFVFNMIGYSL